MPFPPSERRALLAVKGVGLTVVTRLEQMGIESLAHLATASAADLLTRGAQLSGSSCWKNSPQARAAITGAIAAAQDFCARGGAVTMAPGAMGAKT